MIRRTSISGVAWNFITFELVAPSFNLGFTVIFYETPISAGSERQMRVRQVDILVKTKSNVTFGDILATNIAKLLAESEF